MDFTISKNAIVVRVPRITSYAGAIRNMIQNMAASICTAKTCTRILTFIVNASQIF